MFETFLEDRCFIERKYHIPEEPFNPYKPMEYHGYDYDGTTGKSDAEIKAGLCAMEPELEGLPHPVAKAKVIGYVLENTRIDVGEHDCFVGLYSWEARASLSQLCRLQVYRARSGEPIARHGADQSSACTGAGAP